MCIFQIDQNYHANIHAPKLTFLASGSHLRTWRKDLERRRNSIRGWELAQTRRRMAGESRNRANENGTAMKASEVHFQRRKVSLREMRSHRSSTGTRISLVSTRGPPAWSPGFALSKIVAILGQDSVHSNTSLQSQLTIFKTAFGGKPLFNQNSYLSTRVPS